MLKIQIGFDSKLLTLKRTSMEFPKSDLSSWRAPLPPLDTGLYTYKGEE